MNKTDKLNYLIKYLLSENKDYANIAVPERAEERFGLFRGLVNVLTPKPISEEFLAVQDELLREMIAEKGVVDYKELSPVKPRIYLWQGDITALKCGAIVNAANSAPTTNLSKTRAGTRRRSVTRILSVREKIRGCCILNSASASTRPLL